MNRRPDNRVDTSNRFPKRKYGVALKVFVATCKKVRYYVIEENKREIY